MSIKIYHALPRENKNMPITSFKCKVKNILSFMFRYSVNELFNIGSTLDGIF